MNTINKNKKGQVMNIIYIFVAIFIVITIALLLILITPIIREVSDTVLPALKVDFATIPQTNVSVSTDAVITPVQTIFGMTDWIWGVAFVIAIVLIFGLAVATGLSSSRFMMVLWLAMSVLLILFSILVSNIVEGMASGGGTIESGITQQSLLYYLLLNSPVIFIIVTFISGIIVFAGLKFDEEVF